MNIRETINEALARDGLVILPPMDVSKSFDLVRDAEITVSCTMLDPWYNKGIGGELPTEEYDAFIAKILNMSAGISELIYLWGFPEVIGPYVRFAPDGFYMASWLTWYYKNCPSVIRGWRSSQNACLQFMRKGYKLHPEHFLNDEQKDRFDSGKMRCFESMAYKLVIMAYKPYSVLSKFLDEAGVVYKVESSGVYIWNYSKRNFGKLVGYEYDRATCRYCLHLL